MLLIVDTFVETIRLSTASSKQPTLTGRLLSVMRCADDQFTEYTPIRNSGNAALINSNLESTSSSSLHLLQQIEHLRDENDAMKIHLTTELSKLQEENQLLRKRLQTAEKAPSQSSESAALLTTLKHAVSESTSTSTTNSTTTLVHNSSETQQATPDTQLDETLIKKFNCLPKKLPDFYTQMELGSGDLPKFTDFPDEFKKNSRTQGTYSKSNILLY